MDRLSVLLVDDDVVDRTALRRLLQGVADVEIVEAETGEEARAALNARPWDCVLLDYFLPDLTAAELLADIQAKHPAPGVVALTGLGDESIAVELMKAGVHDYLNKARLDGRLLLAAIRGAVGHARARTIEHEMMLAQRRHTARLEALALHAPALVGSLSLPELCARAVDVCLVVLDAHAAAVCTGIGEACDVSADHPDNLSDRGHIEHRGERIDLFGLPPMPVPGRPIRVPVDDGSVILAVRIVTGEVGSRLAVRVRAERTELDVVEAVFAQLALVLARSLENARLLRHIEREVRLRDEVMAVVSHDLRGPLGNALLACELLEPGLSKDDKAVLARMSTSLTHMRGLVDDLVEAVRARNVDDESELTLQKSVVDVAGLVDDAAALIEESCRRRRIRVTTSAPPQATVGADRHRLLQVLGNLLQNAVKFTPDGGSVVVAAEVKDDGVTFSVQDSGPGIPEDALPHIFERFFRAQHDGRGLGLGLAIARSIVVAHGGTIRCESPPGKGALFTFKIPRGDVVRPGVFSPAAP